MFGVAGAGGGPEYPPPRFNAGCRSGGGQDTPAQVENRKSGGQPKGGGPVRLLCFPSPRGSINVPPFPFPFPLFVCRKEGNGPGKTLNSTTLSAPLPLRCVGACVRVCVLPCPPLYMDQQVGPEGGEFNGHKAARRMGSLPRGRLSGPRGGGSEIPPARPSWKAAKFSPRVGAHSSYILS